MANALSHETVISAPLAHPKVEADKQREPGKKPKPATVA